MWYWEKDSNYSNSKGLSNKIQRDYLIQNSKHIIQSNLRDYHIFNLKSLSNLTQSHSKRYSFFQISDVWKNSCTMKWIILFLNILF